MGYYVVNAEREKIELHFEKSEYMDLSDEEKSKVKGNFLFSRKTGTWVSRCKALNLGRPEKVAKDLGLEYKGEIGERKTFAERQEAKADRAERRADALDSKADRIRQKADGMKSEWKEASKDWAFVTQPITSNSGGRAFARQREKMLNRFEKGIEEGIRADACENRAETARETASNIRNVDNAFAQRRVDEAEAAIRSLNRKKKWFKSEEEWAEKVARQKEKREYYLAIIEQNGGIQYSKSNLKKGDIVKIRRYPNALMQVVSTGPKNVKLADPLDCFALPYPYAEITEKVEVKECLKDAKEGDLFIGLGDNVWVLDSIYEISEEFAKENELCYRTRYKAHLLMPPKDPNAMKEIDAAYVI